MRLFSRQAMLEGYADSGGRRRRFVGSAACLATPVSAGYPLPVRVTDRRPVDERRTTTERPLAGRLTRGAPGNPAATPDGQEQLGRSQSRQLFRWKPLIQCGLAVGVNDQGSDHDPPVLAPLQSVRDP